MAGIPVSILIAFCPMKSVALDIKHKVQPLILGFKNKACHSCKLQAQI